MLLSGAMVMPAKTPVESRIFAAFATTCTRMATAAELAHSTQPTARLALARWLSLVLHPFVMIGVMVGTAAAARQSGGEALRSVALVVVFTILPLAVLMVRQVRRGAWENADASNREERPILFVVG